jgi:hypothetical protein
VLKKKEINGQVLHLATEFKEKPVTTEFPIEYFEELTKLKINYNELDIIEKQEKDELMEDYYETLIKNSNEQLENNNDESNINNTQLEDSNETTITNLVLHKKKVSKWNKK